MTVVVFYVRIFGVDFTLVHDIQIWAPSQHPRNVRTLTIGSACLSQKWNVPYDSSGAHINFYMQSAVAV